MALTDFNGPYTIGQMAEMLAEPGFSSQQCRSRLLHLAKGADRGDGEFVTLLHSYGLHGTGKTAHRLFPFSEVCKAKVFFTLIEQGIADGSALREADFGMVANRAWEGMPEAQRKAIFAAKTSPIDRAIRSIRDGDNAFFALSYFWHPKTDERQYRGDVVFGNDDIASPPKGFAPRSSVLIPLSPLILPLIQKAERAKAN